MRNGPLAGETVQSYGEQVLRAGAGLSTRDPDEIVSTDLKLYEAGGLHFAIAQVEVTDLLPASKNTCSACTQALNTLRERAAWILPC